MTQVTTLRNPTSWESLLEQEVPPGMLEGGSHYDFISDAPPPLEHKTSPPNLDTDDLPKSREELPQLTQSGNLHSAQVSASGIVDAILKVGHQRKLLLAELRAALLRGDDAEALLVARHLCGLA
jgi:hypothetical protein